MKSFTLKDEPAKLLLQFSMGQIVEAIKLIDLDNRIMNVFFICISIKYIELGTIR